MSFSYTGSSFSSFFQLVQGQFYGRISTSFGAQQVKLENADLRPLVLNVLNLCVKESLFCQIKLRIYL
jgi:hypothetical protein